MRSMFIWILIYLVGCGGETTKPKIEDISISKETQNTEIIQSYEISIEVTEILEEPSLETDISNHCIMPSDCDDQDPCTIDICDGICQWKDVDCDDGDKCTNDICDPRAGGCIHMQIQDCKNPCQNDKDCDDNDACTVDLCKGGKCISTPFVCNDNNECTKDYCDKSNGCIYESIPDCIPHTCEKVEDCDDKNLCTLDKCLDTKKCSYFVIDCDDKDDCTKDYCESQVGCVHILDFSNPSCGCIYDTDCKDNNACTQEKCEKGKCSYPPVNCNDNDPCTLDYCDVMIGCKHQPISGCVTPCQDDSMCEDDDKCTLDKCNLDSGLCEKEPMTCNDFNLCTEDGCDPQIGCVHKLVSCDDNNQCTEDDCEPTTGCVYKPVWCDDGDPCTNDICIPTNGCVFEPIGGCLACTNDKDCDDNNLCTYGICKDGICEFTTKDCEDGNKCTIDTCEPDVGCVSKPLECDDNNPCTKNLCAPAKGCTFPAIDCTDNNPCTVEYCSPSQGGCVYIAKDGIACDDGDACTTDDICKDKECIGGAPKKCDDGNICTDDLCDKEKGCIYLQNKNPCNDNDACTINDTCTLGKCVGQKMDCSDGISCTVDWCDSKIGCINLPNNDLCDDNNSCTKDICVPKMGCKWEILPDGTPCDDGDLWTQGDFCKDGECQGGGILDNFALILPKSQSLAYTKEKNFKSCFSGGWTVESWVFIPMSVGSFEAKDVIAHIGSTVYLYVRIYGEMMTFVEIACLKGTGGFGQYIGGAVIFSASQVGYKWHHIACTGSGMGTGTDSVNLYIDGKYQKFNVKIEKTIINPPDQNLYVGIESGTLLQGQPFKHDETRLSSNIRYAGESFTPPDLYEHLMFDKSTCALWHFDEKPGSSEFVDEGYKYLLHGINGATTGEH